MNANASWDQPPAAKQAAASWYVNDSAKVGDAASLFAGKDKKTLMTMFKMAQQNQKPAMKPKTGMTGAMSTSALSNIMLRQPDPSSLRVRSKASIGEHVPGQDSVDENPSMDGNLKKSRKMNGTRLRKETLMSLGIETKKPVGELRGCMKKGDGLKRAATLGNFREISATGPDGRPIKRNVSITFKETVEIKRVPSASSLAGNRQDLWFQDHEEREIRKTAKALVKIVDESDVDPSLLDLHGLESHTRINKKISQARKYDAWDAVMDAQDIIRNQGGEYNDEEIASMVRAVSAQSLQDAQARARQYTVSS
ncbi:hypothetical protein IV203_002883 [Nitzschia inconspicua]|uniref:Uncharacterized protein n=1 Tax=Nitzschia inconspicua TaxID=303405 RepID=A0A9K3L0P0_9STRA|nr:hypothetical protein IV203_002883 [Nitzschia inconspicua]